MSPQPMQRPMPAPAPTLQVAPPAAFQPPGSQPQPLSPTALRPAGPSQAPTTTPPLEPGQIVTKTESQVRKVGHGADAHYVSRLTPEEKKRRRRLRTTVMFIVCLSVLLTVLAVLAKVRPGHQEEEAPAAPTLEDV